MLEEVHIFDFDGTLVDSSHRYRTRICEDGVRRIDLDYWRENEGKCSQDSLLPMSKVYKLLNNDPKVFTIIATARVMCENCHIFIGSNLGAPNHVISRGSFDQRGGVEMKLAGIRKLFNLKQFREVKEVVVYEDNLDYLAGLCSALNARPVYVESNQGY